MNKRNQGTGNTVTLEPTQPSTNSNMVILQALTALNGLTRDTLSRALMHLHEERRQLERNPEHHEELNVLLELIDCFDKLHALAKQRDRNPTNPA